MKSAFVESLVPNETVTAQFLVLSKEIRQKKTGEPYLTLYLADRTGEIEAKMWDNVVEVMHTFERDHFIKVKGIAQLYNNRSQFTIHKLRKLEDTEVEFGDFFPCSERDPEVMYGELTATITGISNPHLRGLLELVFADANLRGLYKVAPAAKSIHHACRSGLIEHVLSLCEVGRLIAPHYPEVDRDLLITGIILHDIGKVEELSYARSFGYSSEGQLLGHIVLGLRLLATKFEQLPQFPRRLRTLVEHMILSHHGELEFGSPKVPMFGEAMLLHHLDNLDSKMNAVRNALKRDRNTEGEFTGWIASLERVLLRKELYLNGGSPAVTPVAHPDEPELPRQEQTVPEKTSAAQAQERPPAPIMPAAPQTPTPAPARPPERRPEPARHPTNTLFGEKLQAVLGDRK
jgi:3'-5' exoribonuclease